MILIMKAVLSTAFFITRPLVNLGIITLPYLTKKVKFVASLKKHYAAGTRYMVRLMV